MDRSFLQKKFQFTSVRVGLPALNDDQIDRSIRFLMKGAGKSHLRSPQDGDDDYAHTVCVLPAVILIKIILLFRRKSSSSYSVAVSRPSGANIPLYSITHPGLKRVRN
jgi:hypothetical protein